LKDPEIGKHYWCRLSQKQTEDFLWINFGPQVLHYKSVSGRKEEEKITNDHIEENPAIDKSCYIAVRKDLDTAI
jgi:hypothetical protein